MSRLDKLQITGCRAFPTQYGNTIQFFAPLTLIVGTNGSGKTTIIECLKYATTGEMPPNSARGASFIHDPQLDGEKEVRGQVKLSFLSAGNVPTYITRSMQLTVKKNTRTFKTLEQTVKIKMNGETSTISLRNTNLNVMMPRYLGLSRAVLEYVVFCHQDESFWPLYESKKLKEIFDQIFEAHKYTKAVDTIKVLQKNQRTELGKMEIIATNAKTNKDRAKKMETRMIELSGLLTDLNEQDQDLRAQIQGNIRAFDEAWRQAAEASNIVGELKGKRIERDTKEESIRGLRDSLDPLSESDAELQELLTTYDERVQSAEGDADRQKQQYAEISDQIDNAREAGSAKERECGKLEEQKQSYDRSIAKRQRLVKETARAHSIRGYDGDVDDTQAQAFIDRVAKMERDQNAAFERARRETQDELQRAQKALNQIYEQKSAFTQSKQNTRKAMDLNDGRINNLQNQLNKINYDEGATATLDSKLKDVQTKLQDAKTEMERSASDGQIGTAETELRQLEDRKEAIDAELVEATRRAGDTAQLDIRQKELKDAKSGLHTMMGAHGDGIASVVGKDWKPETLEDKYQGTLKDISSAAAQAERQRDGTIAEQKQVEFKLNSCRADLSKKQNALKAAEKAIKKTVDCEPEDYPAEVRQLEHSRDVLKSDNDALKMITEYFDNCLKFAKDKNACKTCARVFNKPKELDHMVKMVQKEKDKLKAIDEDQEQLKEIEDTLQAARDVSTDFDTWERVKHKELPALQAEESKLDAQIAQLTTRIEEQDTIVRDKMDAKRDIETTGRNVQKVLKHHLDIARLEEEIENLKDKQKLAGKSRGLEAIQDDGKEIAEAIRTAKSHLAQLTAAHDRRRNKVNTLELESRDLKSQLSTAEFQLKEKKSLEAQIAEYKGTNSEHRETLKSLDSQLDGLVPQLSTAQEKYDDIEQRGREKDSEMQRATTKLNSSANELKMANADIDDYHARGGAEQLARGRREVENLKDEVIRLDQERNGIVQQVKRLEEQLRNHTEMKRRIVDNQRFRRDQQQLKRVNAKIAELESLNAEEEKAHWDRVCSKLMKEREKLSADQSLVIGQAKANDEQFKQLKDEWNTDGKDAAKEYRHAVVMVETTKAAIEDLGRYGSALDKAIMKYHTMKMDQVNSIIDELWRRTYQGTDVDTIIIRSDNETVRANKTYNYRVCMVKQDVEMDMRGRCSAGQKVLACIIIRLALAECFGSSCGMIALDEPTTNLDTDNILALAASLAKIIRHRRTQRNFQLIVITHDEDFLRMMNCADYTDYYWRVSRDDNQKSRIEKNAIADVMR